MVECTGCTIAIWLANGLRIAEFPTHYVGRGEGISKLRWIDLVKASIVVFEIAGRLRFKKFKRLGNVMPADEHADANLARSLIE